MKLLIILLPLWLFSASFSPAQLATIKLAIELGKPYDLSNTLAGIVMVESKAGVYQVNPSSEDYGVTGININSFLNRMKIPNTYYNRSKYATHLITDQQYAIKAALSELIYWRDVRRRTSWYHYVGSYNQGNTVQSNHYAQEVAKAIKQLKHLNIL